MNIKKYNNNIIIIIINNNILIIDIKRIIPKILCEVNI